MVRAPANLDVCGQRVCRQAGGEGCRSAPALRVDRQENGSHQKSGQGCAEASGYCHVAHDRAFTEQVRPCVPRHGPSQALCPECIKLSAHELVAGRRAGSVKCKKCWQVCGKRNLRSWLPTRVRSVGKPTVPFPPHLPPGMPALVPLLDNCEQKSQSPSMRRTSSKTRCGNLRLTRRGNGGAGPASALGSRERPSWAPSFSVDCLLPQLVLCPHARTRNVGNPVAFRGSFCRWCWTPVFSVTWLEHRECGFPRDTKPSHGWQTCGVESAQGMLGLRTSPRRWQEHLSSKLKGHGFVQDERDPCLFANTELDIYLHWGACGRHAGCGSQ